MSGVSQLIEIIRTSKINQEKWSKTSLTERVDLVRSEIPNILAALGEILECESSETGVSKDYMQLSRKNIENQMELLLGDFGRKDVTPVGLGAVILPRVLVSETLLLPTLMGIALGNTMVIKGSSCTPRTVAKWQKFFALSSIAKFSDFIVGNRLELGKILFDHPGINFTYFCGRTESFADIPLKIGKRYLGRLGTQNPAIVFSDADIGKTINILMEACFEGSGRLPQNVSRIFVDEKIGDEFIGAFLERLKQKVFIEFDSDAKDRERVEQLLSGSDYNILFKNDFGVKVIEDLTFCSELHQMDVQVPLVLVNKVKYLHEAIKWSDTNPYAYKAYLFSEDQQRARKIAAKLRFGEVALNCGFGVDPANRPGIKSSGFGEFSFAALGSFLSDSRQTFDDVKIQ